MDIKLGCLTYWQQERKKTIEMVDLIPQEHAEYRVSEDTMSFREHVLHLLSIEFSFIEGLLGKGWDFDRHEGSWRIWEPYQSEKYVSLSDAKKALQEGTVKHRELLESLENWTEPIENPFAPPLPAFMLLQILINHENDHRGQLFVYLKQHGVSVPTPGVYGAD
ncbi:DinB family protein [Laceyella putida]|uniref:DinB family protein n=1 Tax=Laceyella putida TaxID=110101 RepID=A0ABW2RJ06_9BACL